MITDFQDVKQAIKTAINNSIKEAKSQPNSRFNMNIVFVHALDYTNNKTINDFKYNPDLDFNYTKKAGKDGAIDFVKAYEIYDAGLIYTAGLNDQDLAQIVSSARFRYVYYKLLKTCEIPLTDEFNPVNAKKILAKLN